MTNIDEFNYTDDCEKIDASCIDASVELLYNEDNKLLKLESSWGDSEVDPSQMVKDYETLTTLKLSPEEKPTYLEYIGEDGEPQCIDGEDLARIVPMTKLKDVNQETAISNGYGYIYNSKTELFDPYNVKGIDEGLQEDVDDINTAITGLKAQIATLNQQLAAYAVQLQQTRNELQAEIARAEAAEKTLQDNIDAEAAARAAADNTLQTNIDNEAKARTAADNTLQQNINNEETRAEAAEKALDTRTTALETLTTRPSGVPTDTVLAWGNINVYGDKNNTSSHSSGVFTHNTSSNKTNDLYFA